MQRWVAPVPAERLGLVRLLVCGYATVFAAGRSVYLLQASRLSPQRWHPVGLFSPWSTPPPRVAMLMVWLVVLAAGIAATLGWRFWASGPLLAASFMVLSSYGVSWGQLFHTEHLISLHLVVLAAAGASAGIACSWPRGGERSRTVSGWPLRLMTAVTAITYLLAGVAKLRLGGWDWLSGDALRHQVAYDNIRKELVGSVSSPVAGFALRRPWLWWPIGVATIAVELGAPVFVLSARWRRWWIGAAWLFHLGIVALMAIVFTYPVSGVAYASMARVERPLERWSNRRNERNGPS